MSGDRERAEPSSALALPLVLAVPVFAAYVLSAAPPATVRRGVTFVNPYPTRRELLRVVGGNATLVATLNASGGEHVVELRDGDVYGWRERSRKRPRPLEDSVALRGGDARDVYVLGDATGGDATFTNGSPLTVTATHRSGNASNASRLLPNSTAVFRVRSGDFVDWATDELRHRTVVDYAGHGGHVFEGAGALFDLCASATPASRPLRRTSYLEDGAKRRVDVLSEAPYVAFLPDWTTADDCDALREAAEEAELHDAVVSGRRASLLSVRRSRNAMLEWDAADPGFVVNRLAARAHAFARRAARLDVDAGPHAEPLNFIRYAEAGEYRAHCDGVCRRYPYKRGGRVATMIHYCTAPGGGGATVFPNAGLKVAPKARGALFFAYKDPDTGLMDHGSTEHGGCLVTNGTKEITTVWMREDLSAKHPWRGYYDAGIT